MKNVDVAWRLIDVVKQWQQLKKMTSMLLSHPGLESVCLNSWVLATATIGLCIGQREVLAVHDLSVLRGAEYVRGAHL